jgi:pimeloyl-ACP methyl ester carboxylesterase
MRTTKLDDRTVAYDEAGGTDAPPLLIVHGFTGGRGDFAGVLEALAGDRRVVAVDLPGHGGSEGPDDPSRYGLATLADWVLGFADALELGEMHLLGHSLGGLIAQRAAAAASHRLRSLVLMGTGLGAPREERSERIVRIALAARDDGPEAALAESRDGDVQVDPSEHAAALEHYRSLSPAAVVGAARSLVGATPLGAFLRGIDIPVLVVHGDDDQVWLPGEQRLLATTVAGAAHAVVPQAGHSAQRDNPDAWAAIVRGFLRGVDRPMRVVEPGTVPATQGRSGAAATRRRDGR